MKLLYLFNAIGFMWGSGAWFILSIYGHNPWFMVISNIFLILGLFYAWVNQTDVEL